MNEIWGTQTARHLWKIPWEIAFFLVMVTGSNWLVVWNKNVMTFYILGMLSSQLTNSYFSERWLNHQSDHIVYIVSVCLCVNACFLLKWAMINS